MPEKYYSEAERNFVIGLSQNGQSPLAIAARPEVTACVKLFVCGYSVFETVDLTD